MKKKLWCVFFSLIFIFGFAACSVNKQPGSVDISDYVVPTDIETTSPKYDESQVLNPDDEWQSAYALSYNYYDKRSGQSTITEGKCGNYYQSIDNATNIVTFLAQEDGYLTQYMLSNNTATGTATIVTGSTMDDVYSGFVQLSVCDPYFPVYKNVTKVGTDFVAERLAVRYKQVEQENGIDKKIAYVWIDEQYGFASRCELFNAETGELLMKWELLSFTRNVTEEAVKVNVEAYDIVME